MELPQLCNLFENSPALRLLKSQQAAFVLHFLEATFKRGEVSSSGAMRHEDLLRRLALFQDDLRDDGFDALSQSGDHYLIAWSDDGWLRRFLKSDSNEPQYQLTRHSEDAIRFVDSLITRQSRFVGTEGRLRLVIDTLSDIVRGASDNPDRRLEELTAQREEINQQIAAITAGGKVETYPEATIRDRFQTAIELLKTLQGDFRAVEDRFEQIAREVHLQTQSLGDPPLGFQSQEFQSQEFQSREFQSQNFQSQNFQSRGQARGRILAGALDAEDLIRQEDEGVSFYAFVKFLFSPASQETLRGVIDELVRLPALATDREGVRRVRKMLPSLLAEADNVLRQTGRLSETLRRLLDAESMDHRRRLAEVLREIRTTAASLTRESDSPEKRESLNPFGLEVESLPAFRSPFSRNFWATPQALDVTPVDEVVDLTAAEGEAQKLASLKSLRWRRMRSSLAEMTDESSMVTLPQVIAAMPPETGVIEIVGWLQIAHEDGHEIDESASQKLVVDVESDSQRRRIEVTVPTVRYYRDKIIRPHEKQRRLPR